MNRSALGTKWLWYWPTWYVIFLFLDLLSEFGGQPLTNGEALTLHNKVLAMLDKEGLSYQVATWQLYYAEVVKLESETIAMKTFLDFIDKMDGN